MRVPCMYILTKKRNGTENSRSKSSHGLGLSSSSNVCLWRLEDHVSLIMPFTSPRTLGSCGGGRNPGSSTVTSPETSAASPRLLWHQAWDLCRATRRQTPDRHLGVSYSSVQLTKSLANCPNLKPVARGSYFFSLPLLFSVSAQPTAICSSTASSRHILLPPAHIQRPCFRSMSLHFASKCMEMTDAIILPNNTLFSNCCVNMH